MKPELNQVIYKEDIRPNGTRRYALDFSACPTRTEQHTAQLTDINYLMEKHKPDEIAAYIAARNRHRQEIVGHDFSAEPDLQSAKNIVLNSKRNFDALPEDIKKNFSSHLEFLKFIDNPDNKEKMIKYGILTQKEINSIQIQDTNGNTTTQRTQTQDKDTKEE